MSTAVGGDLFFNMGRFTLQGEYDWYQMSVSGPTPNVTQKGGFIQAAALLTRGRFLVGTPRPNSRSDTRTSTAGHSRFRISP